MQYQEWLRTWLPLYVQPTVKIRTYEKYGQVIRTSIIPKLGEYELERLTTDVLQKFVSELCGRFSPNTVNGTITVLQKSLKMAAVLGVRTGYSGGICRPKAQEKRVECFTVVEQRKIENYILQSKKSKLFGVILCLYTGLRIGELLALEWSDIDLVKGLLTVDKSCHYGKNQQGEYGRIVESPKTKQSVRVIPLPKCIVPYLREKKKKEGGRYVINDKNKPIATRSYQNTFALLLKKLKMPHRGFHSLRHTFATRALESGMDVKTLSELLGHKNSTVTLNRYAHSFMEHKRTMMNKLGKFCNLKNLDT